MKVILTQDIPQLGSLGDEVTVKSGYARNYLIPRGIALGVETGNARRLQHQRKNMVIFRKAAIESAGSEAEKLKETKLVFTAKAGENGRLFGSVTNRDIKALLDEQGFDIDRRNIILYEQIKTVGTFEVSVKLHSEVKLDLPVKVVPEFVKKSAQDGTAEDSTDEEGAETSGEGEESTGEETAVSADGTEEKGTEAESTEAEGTETEGTEAGAETEVEAKADGEPEASASADPTTEEPPTETT